jgi:hypothetical protein
MLERGDRAVGVVLMIFTLQGGGAQARCNISSWYVDPLYQGYASLLIAAAIRLKHVTYINVSPATHTRPVIEAQGFRRDSNGQMLCVPILSGLLPRRVLHGAAIGLLPRCRRFLALCRCVGRSARETAAFFGSG